jgi:hypothetical protein
MRTLSYVRPTLAPSASVNDFASMLRAEQLRHLDAVRRACAILDGHAGRLPALASAHGALTRQWFDAQRSLLDRCAQIDVEAERADQLDLREAGVADDIARSQQQLTEILDSWWERENRRLEQCAAVVEAQNEDTQELPIVEAVVTSALPADLLTLLDSSDLASLSSLLESLAASLALSEAGAEPGTGAGAGPGVEAVSREVEPGAALQSDLEILFDPAPRDLEILFDPAPRVPVSSLRGARFRRQRSGRPSSVGSPSLVRSVVRNVVVPMSTITVVLIALMAWIG